MNYVAQSRRPNPAAILGAIGIPAAFGALLVTGLAVTVVVTKDENPIGTLIKSDPPPIPVPPPPPKQQAEKTEPTRTVVVAPTNPIDLNKKAVIPETKLPPLPPLPPGPTPGIGNNLGEGAGTPAPPAPPPPPKFDPISAKPRGNPGTWITTRDYRSNWIRREMTGTAGFTLQISASGRVTGCTVTSSTGHSALDQATCRLVQKRARFTPARDSDGAEVAGTYSNSVTWRLPK